MVGSSEYPLDFFSHEIEFYCCLHPLQVHVHLVSTLEGGFSEPCCYEYTWITFQSYPVPKSSRISVDLIVF